MMKHALTALSVLVATLSGCRYEEGLLIENMRGTVLVPEAAATRTVVHPNGESETITDVKLIGPVFLGLFPSVEEADVIAPYPHPEVGPQFIPGVAGDTYPYGGTTIGDLRFACLEYLTCKVTSGRFDTWNTMIEWFASLDQPIRDASGAEVVSGEYLQQLCFDQLNVTSDEEARLTAYEDRNGDGETDALDLDFVWDESAGAFRGEFTLWQQEFYWDTREEETTGCTPGEDCTGFSLWGWMDSPSTVTYDYSTCDPSLGFNNEIYNNEFFGGIVFSNVLNFPTTYIDAGDVLATEPFVWNDISDQPELVLDWIVE
jgi:hypothetical protein